jgi:MFS family permease
MPDNHQSSYRWFLLALTTIAGTFVAAMPFSCMPVLFEEISEDLGLNLVQIGTVWGFASLAGLFVSILAGILGDKFGIRLVVGISCVLVGITGSLRGFSNSFLVLSLTVFLNGIARLIMPINLNRAVGIWFKGRNLGMAMGISAMGMGLGLMVGPMISATVLSPWLGGWRNVLHLYGALSVIVGILWLISVREPHQVESDIAETEPVPLLQSFSRLIRLKALWLIGIIMLFRVGGIMGMMGYLPLYLREQGWTVASADGTLAVFYAVSTICVVPLSLLSDRLGSRKAILFPALIVTIICLSLIPRVEGNAIYVLMILSGVFMDSFMAIVVTMLLETEGVGPKYSGIALGIVFTISHIGSVSSPPLGNSLAGISQGMPFYFWTALSAVALVALIFSRETGWRKTRVISD